MSKILIVQISRTLLMIILLLARPSVASSIFDKPQWLLGVIATPELSILAGEAEATQVIPYIAWTTEHWHVGIEKISYEVGIAKDLNLELLAKPRFGSSLPKNVERYGNIEREFALEAGAAVSYDLFPLTLEAELLADTTGTHGGYLGELSASLEIPYQRFEMTASAAMLFKDRHLTQHLYGVTKSQATSQISPYLPGADWAFEVGIEITHMLSKRCVLIAQATATLAGNEARQSPLTDRDIGVDGVIGVVYVF